MNHPRIIILAIVFLFGNTLVMGQTNWEIASNYTIEFDGSGAEGNFGGLQGTIQFDPESPESGVFKVEIDPSTISTGNETKDKHARGDSWFDVMSYPRINFQSKSVVKTNTGFLLTGRLEMHGISQEIEIPFTFSTSAENNGLFEGRFSVNREDFGIKGPLLGMFVGDYFEVLIKVPVSKK